MGSKKRRHATKMYNPKKRNKIPFPLKEINSICWVYYQSETPCLAQIIERRQKVNSIQYEYYVHYLNHDRRLDEWIDQNRFLNQRDLDKHQKSGFTVSSINHESNRSNTIPLNTLTEKLESKENNGIDGDGRGKRRFKSLRLQSNHELPSTLAIGNFNTHRAIHSTFLSQTINNSMISTGEIIINQRKPLNDPILEALEKEHEEATKVKNIQMIEIGRYEIDCWYFSPYPDEYSENIMKLFVCEKCLKYMKNEKTYIYHWGSCDSVGPPGKLIYWKDGLVIYELDGTENKLYCQNLCLMSKLFLDHKTLYYDVSPFWFYVLCEVDEFGVHIAGYFSKEKQTLEEHNLACIMILPPYQKKGYGRFLIDLSYEITKREGKIGSPEKPLSDLGLVGYRSYWTFELVKIIKSLSLNNIPSLKELSDLTGFTIKDIIETLEQMRLLKTWRGQQVLCINNRILKDLWSHYSKKKICELDRESLIWP